MRTWEKASSLNPTPTLTALATVPGEGIFCPPQEGMIVTVQQSIQGMQQVGVQVKTIALFVAVYLVLNSVVV